MEEVHAQQGRRPSVEQALEGRRGSVSDRELTGSAMLSGRQSVVPIALVTILFFMWGFAYGLLDVLNSRFQVALDITKGQSSGLQGA